MKPNDTFYYLKHNKIAFNANSLIKVYQPIIGNDALALYNYLIQFSDEGRREHKFTEILNHLQFGMNRLEEALALLTAMDLLVFYQKVDHYLLKLNAALEVDEFISNPILRRLLEQKIGELAVSELDIKIPKDAHDISKKFSDLFGKLQSQTPKTVNSSKSKVSFDLDSFKQLMTRDGLQFANEQEDVIRLFSISEEYKMTWFDTYQLARATAINYKISPTRIVTQKKQELAAPQATSDFSQAELAVIREAKTDNAQLFLEKIKKVRRASVTKDERNLLVTLAEMGFLDEVINIMVLYTFNKTKSANLQKNYVMKMANDFSYQGVANAEEATMKMRSFEERKAQATSSKAKPAKTNVPEWSNPDYQESTSPEEQVELDRFKEQALKRLENLRKGGD